MLAYQKVHISNIFRKKEGNLLLCRLKQYWNNKTKLPSDHGSLSKIEFTTLGNVRATNNSYF